MNAKQRKLADALAALSGQERERLGRLALLAQVTSEDIWPGVYLYGFDDMEDSVQADLDADADVAAGRTISNEEVMEDVRRLLASHAHQPKRKAG